MNFELRNTAIGLTSLLLAACQVIPEEERLIPVEQEETNRTTLLVEFSGLRCSNCPLAAEEAHNLLSMYGENFVVVEMHPASNTLTQAAAQYDYTCPASDTYYIHCGGTSSTPLPTGVMNLARTDADYFVDYLSWGAAYSQSAKKMSPVRLTHTVQMDTTNNSLEIEANIFNLSLEAFDVQYIAWLTEDSIVGMQMMPNGKTRKDYVHNHVLRDAITDVWGMPLEIPIDGSKSISLSYTLPEKVNPANCNIVGIVMKDGEVIQAQEYKLKDIE